MMRIRVSSVHSAPPERQAPRGGLPALMAGSRAAAIGLAGILLFGQMPGDSANAQLSTQPIEIEASQSLEWLSEQNTYIARGDAQLRQGDVMLFANTLTANYREDSDGKTEIWRVVADGNVRIATPTQQVSGDHGVYDVRTDVFTLTGSDLRLETEYETITASDSLEYWKTEQVAVARGSARAVRGGDQIDADELKAEMSEANDGQMQIENLAATGNVVVTTPTDIARGDHGLFNRQTNIATLSGSVRLTRGQNQLNGDLAEVNLDTGVSRLLSQPGAGGRVQGIFAPKQ